MVNTTGYGGTRSCVGVREASQFLAFAAGKRIGSGGATYVSLCGVLLVVEADADDERNARQRAEQLLFPG